MLRKIGKTTPGSWESCISEDKDPEHCIEGLEFFIGYPWTAFENSGDVMTRMMIEETNLTIVGRRLVKRVRKVMRMSQVMRILMKRWTRMTARIVARMNAGNLRMKIF
jgi:hypothetical protein